MVCAMERPVIGLCTALERARWSVWDQQAAMLPRNYVEEVNSAGGLAVLLAPDARLVAEPDEALALLDGLLLAGGADIDPASYGQTPHAETHDSVPERDAFEIALTRAAIERDLPLLGICRGMQLINVALGGTLEQHLP
jgi:putative glutamine amidotransferase